MDTQNPLFKAIAQLLIAVMCGQPLLSAAADLRVDASAGGNTQISQAANGVPVVNIATPNGNGLSHNKFTDYNVGQQGLILNNSTDKFTQTQLGGIIVGNSQLNGRAAGMILNEVTGGQASQLKGYTEVAGKQAHVVVANPHGITCDGCGFINTPHATLTTGKPIIEQGQLKRYDVDGGQIEISGAGLNATNVSQFDLITRSAKINAELHANQLNIITGLNSVDAQTLTATAKADRPDDKPSLAIDSSALGGMYAGAIRLVGTEAGVGVKLAGDMAASAGDIRIDTNGHLSLARTAAKGDIKLNAAQIDLTQDVYSQQSAQIIAQNGAITVNDSLAAAGVLDLNAALIDNQGVIESGVNADGSSNTASILTVQGGEFKNQGTVVAQGDLNTDLNVLNNQGGQIVAVGATQIDAKHVDNRGGQLIGQQTLNLKVQHLDNAQGTLASNHGLTIQASDQINNTNDGLILSQSGDLSITSQTINNQSGVLQANTGAVNLTASGLLNNQNGKILANSNSLQLNAQQLNNQKGVIQAHSIDVAGGGAIDNRQGQVTATQGNLQLAQAAINNDGGKLISQQNLTVDASSMSNQSGLIGGQEVAVSLTGHLNNKSGLVEATNSLLLSAGSASNDSGRLRALGQAGSSAFTIKTLFNNDKGLVEVGNQHFLLNSQALSNQQGTIRHLGDHFALSLSDAGQAGGSFLTNGILKLDVDRWLNSSELQAQQIELKVNHFTNTASGVLRSIDDLYASGSTWMNDGQIETEGALHLSLTDSYTGKGALHSQGNLYLKSQNVDLQQGASVRSAQNALFELGGRLLNAGALSAAGDVQIRASDIDNQATLGAGQKLRIETNNLLNQGLIFSGADMALRSNTLTNLYGDIYSLGALTVAKDDAYTSMTALENRSGSIESSGDMGLYASTLTNRKEQFRLGKTLTSGYIDVVCYDCSGDHHNVDYVATERFELTVEEDSAAARIHSGGNLAVQGDAIVNRYSSISASGNINIIADTLENLAASTGTAQRVQRFNTGRVTDGTDERFRWNYIYPYNAQGLPKALPSALYNWRLVSDIETQTSTGSAAPAIIQAGGNIHIQARETINNASLLENQAPTAGAAQIVNTHVESGSQPLVVQLNAQLPADLSQQLVDPTTLPGFSLPQSSSGLFTVNSNTSHPYLIETNPLFASMSGFLNSNYLLQGLGYDPQQAQKRLGDGLYEQRLIEQAVIARTGKRFLDGLTSNDDQFRYLMDNGIASKKSLRLSLGVSLTAEQVAALTHDIVWLEEREVQGEKVLVPILYLAQATDRVTPTGALIQGRDVALISGAELNNSGMLRASQNLSVNTENISNSGLIQADERLQLLAQDSIHNQRGGLIKGRDVSLLAVSGDILNERTITQETRSGKGFSQTTSIVDQAAGIEAAHDLSLMAGRDIINQGANLKADGVMDLNAGRNVLLVSAEENNGQMRQDKRHFWSNSIATQHASDIQAGTQLNISAGQDVAVVASHLKSGGDMTLQAGGDVLISSAANTQSSEYRYRRSGKKVNQENSQTRQQAVVLEAGGNIALSADNDLNIIASEVKAANNVSLAAGQDVHILSDTDESASFYSKKSKGSFGRSKSKQQESYDSTNVASVIDAGNNLTINTRITDVGGLSLEGGRNVTVIGSQLNSGHDLLVGATNDIAVLSGVEEHGSYSKKTKSGFLGFSKSGKNQLKTTATQVGSELRAANDVVLVAGKDLGLRASTVDAGNDIELRAGLLETTGDINLLSANNEAYSLTERYRKKIGLSVSDSMLSFASAKKAGQAAQATTSVGSQVSAEGDASLQAERDINIVGSGVSAGGHLLLDAGRDVQVVATQNQQATNTWQRERRSGIAVGSDRNGFTAFAGNDTQIDKRWDTQQTAAASQLNAGLDLDVYAGRDVGLAGSDLIAGRDINLAAERNIQLDAASEQRLQRQEETSQRTGLTVNISHNAGNTLDAVKDIGRGDNAISKVSSVLKAADSVTQFVSGPTTAEHLGTTRQQTTTIEGIQSYRESTLDAGRDINLQAGQDVEARGTRINSQRDINIAGQNITLDVARGQHTQNVEQTLSQSGINGGTTFNSARVGIGGSHGTQTEEGGQGTALPTQLYAGRDVNLDASKDLTLIGTQVQAQRDIQLNAGQDLTIRAAQNDSNYETRRRSGGGEVGLALGGQDFISVYASVDIGKGRLDRESAQQQEAYLYAGNHLKFNSGRDSTIAGAQLEGEQVIGRVGRNLLVASVPDTGKVSGKELDASVTVSIGYGSGSVSGSVGVGKTTGSTDWVENQTRIIARDGLDIRTENHTQLDGALLASNTDSLKLDTDTLGFRDLEGYDKERSWYVNAGGTYTWGSDSGNAGGQPTDGNAAAKIGVVDSSQDNKEGSNQWNVSGYHSEKEREQIVRATVGKGDVIVRNNEETGHDSTQGLNRDTSKAYEITKDKKETTELYVSSSSLDAARHPIETYEQWKQGVKAYGLNSAKAFLQMGLLKDRAATAAETNNLIAVLAWAPSLLVDAMDSLNKPTGGIFPGVENHGGLATQVPALAVGDLMIHRAVGKLKLDENTGQLVIEKGKPVLDGEPVFDSFDGFRKDEKAHISTNGIMNSLLEALTNGLMQGGMEDGQSFVLAYNPTHGLIGDLIESAFDSAFKGSVKSGTARNLDGLYQQASQSPIKELHIYGHSQGGLLTWVAIKGQDFSNIELVTAQLSGAPVDAMKFHKDAEIAGIKDGNSFFQVNRSDEKIAFGLPKTDTVADLPGLGGNAKYSDNQVELTLGAIFSMASLFDTAKSAHSNYSCESCGVTGLTETARKVRSIVIDPTLIDKEGNAQRLNK